MSSRECRTLYTHIENEYIYIQNEYIYIYKMNIYMYVYTYIQRMKCIKWLKLDIGNSHLFQIWMGGECWEERSSKDT